MVSICDSEVRELDWTYLLQGSRLGQGNARHSSGILAGSCGW